MNDLESIWHLVCTYFQAKTTEMSYRSWITTAKPLQFTDNTLLLEVPSVAHRDYWNKNLTDQADAFLEKSLGEKITVLLKLPEEPNPFTIAEEEIKAEEQAAQSNYSDSLDFSVKTTSSNASESQLNEKYTFDTFVDGNGTRMAYAAALAVAEEPADYYNPLFIYGGVGLGKTHLMHAIGNRLLQENPNARIKYVSSEAFANDFINSIKSKNSEAFRQKYRNLDLLLVDDIQFFAEKDGTQEEFFHTFNALYDDKKQIVLTSDRLPNEIPKLQKRLVSRFRWGLSVDITPPDFETRTAILRKKAESDFLDVSDDALSYIAGKIDSNIRELEGALMRVSAYAKLKHQRITTSLAAEALSDLDQGSSSHELTISEIQNKVAKYYHVTVSELRGKKRVKTIVIPRQIAMYLSRKLTDASLPKIGQDFGGKDHTTVIHAYDKITKAVKKDNAIKKDVNALLKELKR